MNLNDVYAFVIPVFFPCVDLFHVIMDHSKYTFVAVIFIYNY